MFQLRVLAFLLWTSAFSASDTDNAKEPLIYPDGAAQAPAGIPLLPNLLTAYKARPPWNAPGVDYAVGFPAGTLFKDPETIAMAGVLVDPARHLVTITENDVTLNGFDFSSAGGWGVFIEQGATNTVIENSYFHIGSNKQVPINAAVGSGNLTVLDDTFDGGSAQSDKAWALINYSGSGLFIARYNAFLNAPADAIDFNAGTMTTIVEYNLFDNLGTSPGSHPDSVQYVGVQATNSIDAFNTIYQPNPGGMQGIQLEAQNGSSLTNSTIQNNVIIAKGAGARQMSYSIAVIQDRGNTINKATIKDNYINYSGAYGPFYPPTGSNLKFTHNVSIVTGEIIQPVYRTP